MPTLCVGAATAADNERKVSKAARGIDVDVVCIDCEDAVALTQKEAARNKVAEYLASKLSPLLPQIRKVLALPLLLPAAAWSWPRVR